MRLRRHALGLFLVLISLSILVLATRDGIVLAGGLYYPVLTGRRDSKESFFDEAMAEIPRPNGNITETLRLFSLRGLMRGKRWHYLEDITSGRLVVNSFGQGSVISWGQVYLIQRFLLIFLKS
uniref:Peroxidase 48 n=1 Tax=Nicotiana tabacum TaxID=4097 RepID=A0A1S4DJ25_TOBAC|nr:PREDICTED: putative Peroxidase 48 [Nicotiana tabacum]